MKLLYGLLSLVLIGAGLVASTPAAAAPTGRTVFRNPINGSADPTMTVYRGRYYLATTQGDRLSIWTSRSIGGLLNAPEQVIWRGADDDPSRSTQIWAPALYKFGKHWYVYYTASDGVDANHRMYVLESAGDDPLGPYHFKAKIADQGVYAIDGEPFVHNGQMYFSWTSPGRGYPTGPQQIYALKMTNPWTAVGTPVALPVDNGGCGSVREGPTGLRHGNQLFLTYSTCDTGLPDYQLWMISIKNGADPLVASNWTKYAAPLLKRNDAKGVYGPGHHSFFKSPDGRQDWIAYHAKNSSAYTYDWRTTRAQQVHWNADGTPFIDPPAGLGDDVVAPSGDPGVGSYVLNDTDAAVSYAGPWNSGNGCGVQCYRGDDHWSNNAGDTATFRFYGTQIALLSVRDTGNGIAGMSIDGGPEVRVDYFANPRTGQAPNYISPKLKRGVHTLTVRVTGEKAPWSGAAYISIDRAEVWT